MSVTIFEGPDGGGKTTLAERWARYYARVADREPLRLNHGPYLGKSGDHIATEYLRDLLIGEHPVLVDRSWPSEGVYGPTVRGVDRLMIAHRRVFERVALSAQAVVVVCLPPYERCKAAYLARKELEYLESDEQLREVYGRFAAYVSLTQYHVVPTFKYDYTAEPSRAAYIDLVENLRPLRNRGPGVGHWRPGEATLMVGEQVNEPTSAAPLPFCSWHAGGCSAWLAEQLETFGVSERELYWVNALDPCGRETEGGTWLEKLRPKRVVALGVLAAAWCKRNVVSVADVREVPHPQWWKRFKHHDEYAPLREALI